MKRLLLCLLFVVICSVARADVQLLPAWERLTPTSVKGVSYAGGLYAAKGETESFQLAVFAPKGSYNVTWSAPAGLTVKAYAEVWTKAAAKAPYWFPDGLLPLTQNDVITLAESKPGAVWFDVTVSRTTCAGNYKIYVKCGATTKTMYVTAWNFALPEQPRLQSAIGLYPTRGQLGAELLLLEHRLMPTFIDSAHKTALNAAGQTQAHVGGYASMSGTSVATTAPSATTVAAWVTKYAPLSAYSYLQDEEYDATALANLQTYSRNMVGKVRRMVTTKVTPSSDWLEIVCAMPKYLTDSLIAGRIAKGKETWMYQTLSQDTYTPKWLLHYNYANWVMLPGWLSYRYRTTGLLMWRADYEKAGINPWVSADSYGTSYPGEASWILPLKDGKPAASFTGATGYAPTMRLKWLRDGVDSYDYLMLLQDRGQGAFANDVTRTVALDFKLWSKDPAALEAARRKLGSKLSAG